MSNVATQPQRIKCQAMLVQLEPGSTFSALRGLNSPYLRGSGVVATQWIPDPLTSVRFGAPAPFIEYIILGLNRLDS